MRATPVPQRQDFVAGCAVIAVAALAGWLARDLPGAVDGPMGPGTLPRALAVLLALLGLALIGVAIMARDGDRAARWTLRGPVLILGSLVAFGFAIRPLGLLAAGPLAIAIASLASDEVRWRETLIYGVLMTLAAIGLFKFALGLPIPLAPWLVGY